jgi:hypothetical protein
MAGYAGMRIQPQGTVRLRSGKSFDFTSMRSVLDAYRTALNELLAKSSVSAVNSIIRMVLDDAGWMWVHVYLPKRFTDYVRSSGYFANAKYESSKIQAALEGRPLYSQSQRRLTANQGGTEGNVVLPQPTPFVLTGRSRAMAVGGSSVEVRVTQSVARILIRVPTGWIKATRQYPAFTTIPPSERQRVTDQIRRSLARLLPLVGRDKPIGPDFRWTTEGGGLPMRTLFPPTTQRQVG